MKYGSPPPLESGRGGVLSAHALLVSVVGLACWAALVRYWGQWLDPNYPTSGLFTMVGAVAVWGHGLYTARHSLEAPHAGWILGLSVLLLLYAYTYTGFPRLVSSAVAVVGLTVVMLATLPGPVRGGYWGLLPWMMASLPIGLAVNAYLGFPLRVAVGHLSSVLLLGEVRPMGAGLSDGVHTVFVDAPCSGVQMLRISVLLAGVVAVVLRLRIARVVALCALAVGLAFLGNTVRVCTLFLLTRRGEVFDWVHEWTGVAIFAGCAGVLVAAGLLLARWQGAEVEVRRSSPQRCAWRGDRWPYVCLAGAVLLAAVVPLATGDTATKGSDTTVPWPASIDGEVLALEAGNPLPAKYRATFLGTAVQGRLSGGDPVLLRQCAVPTLTLHSTEECYRAVGFTCVPLPAVRDSQGHLWSRFEAVHPDGRAYAVRQCFFSIDGAVAAREGDLSDWVAGRASWPDVSSWYWAAARPGASVGVTLAVAVAEPLGE